MASLFYEVRLSPNEEMARDPAYVEKFLVELVCGNHTDRPSYYIKDSAIEIAMQKHKAETAEIIGYKAILGYKEAFPLPPDSVPRIPTKDLKHRVGA